MTATASPILKSRTIPVVFVEFVTTGRHSSVGSAPLHEVIVIRERLRDQREDLVVVDAWAGDPGVQVQERTLTDEHGRLSLAYDAKENPRPYYANVYGQAGNNRLEQVARRIHELFVAGMKPSKLLEVGRPEAQFLDVVPDTDGATNAAALAAGGDAGGKQPAAQVLPPGSGPTAQQSADYKLPEGDEPKPLNGKLIDHLEAMGWEPQASRAIARMQADADGQPILDERLREVRGITNAAALKRIREHLAQFKG